MICHNCGNEVPDGTQKCIYCGIDLNKDTEKEKLIKRFIVAIIAAFLVGIGAGILISNSFYKKDNDGEDTEISTETPDEDSGDKEQIEEPVSESEQIEEVIFEQSEEAVSEQSVKTIQEEENDSYYDEVFGGIGVVIADGVMIRNDASTDAGILGSLNEGDKVEILDVVQPGDGYSWYYIELDNGNHGYMRGDFISIDGEQPALSNNSETTTEDEAEQEIKTNNETLSEVREEERGTIGISGATVTPDVSKAYNMPCGVYVAQIIEGGGAARSDLKEKDIITALNDQEVSSMEELQKLLKYYKAGTEVALTVQRIDDQSSLYVETTVMVILGTTASIQ